MAPWVSACTPLLPASDRGHSAFGFGLLSARVPGKDREACTGWFWSSCVTRVGRGPSQLADIVLSRVREAVLNGSCHLLAVSSPGWLQPPDRRAQRPTRGRPPSACVGSSLWRPGNCCSLAQRLGAGPDPGGVFSPHLSLPCCLCMHTTVHPLVPGVTSAGTPSAAEEEPSGSGCGPGGSPTAPSSHKRRRPWL